MEQIKLNEQDIIFLEENYPRLTYDQLNNTISGMLNFHRSYNDKPIKGNYSIEF